ncbi:MAG: choice-of-anchor D domain-containing protein, partial [Calditrichaeota bacterium]|nr:choice-of-anchor D domain-containing protein [Calditrichota bacterium]
MKRVTTEVGFARILGAMFCVALLAMPASAGLTVDPQAIDAEMNTGELQEFNIDLMNDGDAQINWRTDIEIIREPNQRRDALGRRLRAAGLLDDFVFPRPDGRVPASTDPFWGNGANGAGMAMLDFVRRGGPRRDPPESRYALFKEVGGWGDQMEQMWGQLEANMTQFNSGQMGNFAIDDYDVIWIREYQSDQFNTAWNNNRARFEEWIDAGGVLYHGTGTNNWGVAPVSPGGITRVAQQYSGMGIVDISNDPNADNYSYFAELCNWQGRNQLPGNSWTHSAFRADMFQNMENSDWWQSIAHFNENNALLGVVVYNFGRGWSVVSGTTDSHQYVNWAQQGMWGWALPRLALYLDYLANLTRWVETNPDEGVLQGGANSAMAIILNAEGALDGEYAADVHILSNDRENPDIVVAVTLLVHGASDIAARWGADFGYPEMINWNGGFRDVFVGGNYAVPVTITNTGTAALEVGEIQFGDGEFSAEPAQLNLAPGRREVVNLIFSPSDAYEVESSVIFFNNSAVNPEFTVNYHARSFAPPAVEVNPQAIEDELNTGEQSEHVVNISNTGDAALVWESYFVGIREPGARRDASGREMREANGAGPQRDDPGDVLQEFDIEFPGITGLAWDPDNEVIWGMSHNEPPAIFAFNPENGEIINRFDLGDVRYVDLTYRDGRLYTNGWQRDPQTIHVFDLEGNRVEQIEAPVNMWRGHFTITDDHFFIRMEEGWENSDVIQVFTFPDFEEVGRIPDAEQTGDQSTGQIMWVEADRSGQLWVDGGDQLYQLSVDGGWNCDVVQSFNVLAGRNNRSGLTHDKYDIWRAPYRLWEDRQTVVQRIDDGIAESYWVVWEPTEGVLDAGTDVDVFVTLDATGLLDFEYQGELRIVTNDPQNPEVAVSISLLVHGAPDVALGWELGQEQNLIDWNAYHEDLFTTGTYGVPVQLTNIGTALLNVESIASANEVFYCEPAALELEAGQRTELMFFLHSDDDGRHEGEMIITSNDPGNPEIAINLLGITLSPPIIVVDPQAIEDQLNTGDINEHVVNIANQGQALLRYEISHEIIREPEGNLRRDASGRELRNADGGPRRDDPGDLIAQFNQPQGAGANIYCSPVGYDRENDLAFITVYNNQILSVYTHDNYQNFREVRRWQATLPMDGGFYEGVVYICNLNQPTQVWRFDINGNNIGNMNAGINAYGIAFDHEEGWCFIKEQANNQPIQVYQMDGNNLGQRIGTINNWTQHAANNVNVYALEWVSKHPDGQLWIGQGGLNNNGNQNVYQVHINTENWASDAGVLNFQAGITQPYDAVMHDGHNLWVGGWGPGNIRIYDDGVVEAYWLIWDPQEGEIESGGDQNVVVTLDATGLIGGDYEADMHFLSNDPANADVVLNILMHVTGVPVVDVNWPAGIGYPDVMDWNRAFQDIFSGGPYDIIARVVNVGTDDLQVSDITCDNDAWSFDPVEFALAPGARQDVVFTFNAPEPGEYDGTVTVHSNAPANDGQYNVAVSADASMPPTIVVDPQAIEDDLNTGEMSEHVVNIANDGDALLRWDTDAEIVREPDGARRRDDLRARGLRAAEGMEQVAQVNPFAAMRVVPATNDPIWGDGSVALPEGAANLRPGVNRGGPRRDPPESRFALFKEVAGWGDQMEAIWQEQGADMTQYNSGQMANFPIEEFDAIWIREYQSDAFNTNWNNNRARFEEWVDAGGAIYHGVGTNNWNVVPVHVGGLRRNQQGDGNGVVVVTNDQGADNYNYLAELMQWRGGEVLQGNAWSHASYTRQNCDDIENSDYYQAIAVGQGPQPDRIGVVVYNYGRGWAIATGTTDSHQYNNWRGQAWFWGNALARLIWYLDYLANYNAWLSWDPTDGEIEAGGDQNVVVTLNAEGLVEGDYEAVLMFLSNDPANPQVDVNILLHVTGVPVIEAVWDQAAGFPDIMDWDRWDARFPDLFTGGPYTIPVTVRNVGTSLLQVESINSDHDYFSADPNAFEVAPGERLVVNFILNAEENGEHAGTMTFTSNADNNDDIAIRVHGTTTSPPEIVVDPQAIETDLITGESEEHVINISNNGEALLRWDTDVEIVREPEGGLRRDASGRELRDAEGGPRRDNPGDLIAQFAGPNQVNQYWSPVGYDMDNDLVFLASYTNSLIVVYTHDNYQNFQEVRRWAMPNPMDGCWMDGVLYSNQHGQAFLHRWDANGNNLGNFNVGFTFYGVAADQDNRRMFFREQVAPNYDIRVHEVNDQGQLGQRLGSISNYLQFLDNQIMYQIEWVFRHPEGQLWISQSNIQQIRQIQVNEENWQAIQRVVSFANGGANQPYDAVVHDGHNLWQGGYALANFRIYDDGMQELYWLMYDPQSGEIEAGGDQNIVVTLDATGLIGGDYEAVLSIFSNDPANPQVDVNILAHVRGAAAVQTNPIAHPMDNAPEVLNFANTYVNGQSQLRVVLTNSGTEALRFEGVEIDNPDEFGTDLDVDIELAPREQTSFYLLFHPQDIGQREGRITFISTAENVDDGRFWFDVQGLGQTPPEIGTVPGDDEWVRVVMQIEDDPVTRPLLIRNLGGDGADDLRWAIDIEEIEQENGRRRDASGRGLRSAEGAPRRDPDASFLLIQQTNPWGWNLENDFRAVQGLQYRRVNTPDQIDNLNLDDYQVIYFGNYESDAWTQLYNQRLARVAEWVDGGGVYYMCTGTNNWGVAPVHPGNLTRQAQVYENVGLTVPEQEDNWLMDYLNWDPNHAMNGNSFFHAVYQQNALNNIENSDWLQVIFISQQGRVPVMAVYQYGNGFCLVSGCTDGFLQANFNRDGEWGQAMVRGDHLRYLDFLVTEVNRWLTVEPNEGVTAPGGETEATLLFDASDLEDEQEYYADLLITSNDPVMPLVTVHVQLRTGLPDLRHFGFEETDANHSLLVDDVSMDDETVPTGWEVGVFSPRDVCSGAMVWIADGEPQGFAAWGEEGGNGQFRNGETLVFRLWDDAADEEHRTRATYHEGPSVYTANAFSFFSLAVATSRDLRVDFTANWNLISINVVPDRALWTRNEGPDVIRMTNQLRRDQNNHRVVLMKDERGRFYNPRFGFNNIPYWNLTEGYQVKMDEAFSTVWTGQPIAPNADVPISTGWNFIAYFPDYQLSAAAPNFYVVSPIIDHVLLAKDVAGRFMNPRFRFSNMQPWRETQGYQIKVDADVTLNYPAPQQMQASVGGGAAQPGAGHWAEMPSTGHNMSLLVTSLGGLKLETGDQVGAFSPSGRLVGVGTSVEGQF